jgi:hypothetical protein
MKVRELLQFEIWSKETSRKILLGFGIVVVSLIGVFFIGYEIEIHWLTAGERIAAKAALVQVEELENSRPMTREEFEARSKKVEASVELADHAVRTVKDQLVEMRLGLYLMSVEVERDDALSRQLMQQRHLTYGRPETPDEVRMESMMRELKEQHRAALHKILD